MQERGASIALNDFEQLDTERRRLIVETEDLKYLRNKTNDEIAALKKQKHDASAKIAEMKDVSARIKSLDEQLKDCDEKLRTFQLTIPNIPHASVPSGSNAEANAEVRVVGEKPKFDFEPKPTGNSDRLWEYWTSTAQRKLLAPVSAFTPVWARDWNELSSTSCWMYIRGNTSMSKSFRRLWSIRQVCKAPASCRSLAQTCSKSRTPTTG